jgi:hypothetical protein
MLNFVFNVLIGAIMKTKLRKVTKLWKGTHISLRDYEIQKAIDNNYAIHAVHKGDVMILTPSALKQIDLTVGTPQKSMYTQGTYRLIDVRWRPNDRSNKSSPLQTGKH